MIEIYFAPTHEASPVTLEQLQQRLSQAGLPCIVEDYSADMHWLVFAPHESDIFVSTTGANVTFATFNLAIDDDPRVSMIVEQVMGTIGFRADEDESLGGSIQNG
jgi:hypothetical protein